MFKFGDRVLDSNLILPFALRRIYGVGIQRGCYVCAICGVSHSFRMLFLSKFLFVFLCFVLREFYVLETNLIRRIGVYLRVRMHRDSYRYFCYSHGLPLRGQRTHTNAGTRKRLFRLNKIQLLYK